MRKLLLISLLCSTACVPLHDNSKRAAADMNEGMINAGKHIQSYFIYDPKKPAPPPPPNAAYCYRVMQDIVCYSTPICNAERRLVGWQDGEPGPTFGCSVSPGEPIPAPEQTGWSSSAPTQAVESTPLAPPEPVEVAPPPPVAAEPASDPKPKEYTPIDKVKDK